VLNLIIYVGAYLNIVDNQQKNALSYALESWNDERENKLAPVVLLLSHNATLSVNDARKYETKLLAYAYRCLDEQQKPNVDKTLYNPAAAVAILKQYSTLYSGDLKKKSRLDNINYRLMQYNFKVNLQDKNLVAEILKEVLKLDSKNLNYQKLKNEVITQYFKDKGYITNSILPTELEPIISDTHINPELSRKILDDIGEHYIQIRQPRAAHLEVKTIEAIDAAIAPIEPPAGRNIPVSNALLVSTPPDSSLYASVKKYDIVLDRETYKSEDYKKGKIYLSNEGNTYKVKLVPGEPPVSGSLTDLSDIKLNILSPKERRQLQEELKKWKNQKGKNKKIQIKTSPLLNALIIKVLTARKQTSTMLPLTQKTSIWTKLSNWWNSLFSNPEAARKAERRKNILDYLSDNNYNKPGTNISIIEVLKESFSAQEPIPPEAYDAHPERILKILKKMSTDTESLDPSIVKRAKEEFENYYFTKANDYFKEACQSDKNDMELKELLDKALENCLALPSSNDFYSNFKEMIFNFYLVNKIEDNTSPLSEIAMEALANSAQHPAFSYHILQLQKQQHDTLTNVHQPSKEAGPLPIVQSPQMNSSTIKPVLGGASKANDSKLDNKPKKTP